VGAAADDLLRALIATKKASMRASFVEGADEIGADALLQKAHSWARGTAEAIARQPGHHGDAKQMADWAEVLVDSILDDLADPVPVPHPTDEYFDGILDSASFPQSQDNRLAVRRMAGQMFNLKVAQFLKGILVDEAEIDRFIGAHRWPGRSISVAAANTWAQQILDDAAAEYPGAARYLDDVDERARRTMLESAENPTGSGGFLGGNPEVSLLEFWEA